MVSQQFCDVKLCARWWEAVQSGRVTVTERSCGAECIVFWCVGAQPLDLFVALAALYSPILLCASNKVTANDLDGSHCFELLIPTYLVPR